MKAGPITNVLTALFGQWHPPVWLRTFCRGLVKYKWLSLGLIVASLLCVGGWWFYDSLPKPVTVVAEVDNNELDNKQPLTLLFRYNTDNNFSGPVPEGKPKAAELALLNKPITQGIVISAKGAVKGDQLTPKGEWKWIDDNRLRFAPTENWKPGVQYQISLSKKIFSSNVLVKQFEYAFATRPFSAEFSDVEFYQSPVDKAEKRVRATLSFSHSVSIEDVKQHAKMQLQNVPFGFEVREDQDSSNIAYLISDNITLPAQEAYMRLTLSDKMRSSMGGGSLQEAVESSALIPTSASFFSLKHSSLQIVRDEDNTPQQILTLEFSDATTPEALLEHLDIYLLPRQTRVRRASEFTSAVESKSRLITPSLLPIEHDSSQLFSAKLNVPEGYRLYFRINPGLASANNYIFNKIADAIYRVPNYPRELVIGGEGAILSKKGSLALPIAARGVDKIKFDIGLLLPNQINHMVSQKYGDLSKIDFNNWGFTEFNLAEFSQTQLSLAKHNLKDEVFATLNLAEHLPKQQQLGVYFITAKGTNKRGRNLVTAKRVIVITDLGIVVKADQNGLRHVFVQSIETGKPVSGAEVKLLGLNGTAVVTGKTNAKGYVKLQTPEKPHRSRHPTVFVVSHNNDTSFIPYNNHHRQINTSRFDVGGVYGKHDPRSLNAYVFSDRGIYRPGEDVHFGAVIKHGDLSTPISLPLKLEVFDPQNKRVFEKNVHSARFGFNEFSFRTQASSPTGKYRAVLKRKTDKKRYRHLTTTEFSVEEFLPDTLKIQSSLANTVNKGWNTKPQVTVDVNLQNLFGAAAQDRRVTARYTLSYADFRFNDFKGYDFSLPFERRHKSLNPVTLDAQTTNNSGLSQFNFNLPELDQGLYQLAVHVEGFDQAGGRAVVAKNSARFATTSSLLGFKADGKLSYIHQDSKRTINFIAIDNELNKAAMDGLTLSIVRKQPVSTLIKQRDGRYAYETIIKRETQSREPWQIAETGSDWLIDSNEAGDFDIEIENSQGELVKRLSYSIAGQGNNMAQLERNAELQVKLNKERYQAGDLIEMHITAPYTGSGLITIETGTVEHYKWFSADNESSIQTIKVPKHLEGNAYINVSFVRAADSKAIFTSPLSYAVMPFKVDNPARSVKVNLDAQAIYRPGESMPFSYSTNKPSRLALFAVDTGILQVAKYKAPNPLAHFMKKKALGVKTQQILDLILPDITAMAQFSAPGGGDAMMKALASNLNPFARKADQPAVFWGGIVDADTETKTAELKLPDTFAGEVTLFAVAVGDSSMGIATHKAKVKGAFVISPAILTQAAPGDEFDMTIGINNQLEGSGNGALISAQIEVSEHLQLLGESEQQFNLDEGSETSWRVRAKATDKLGPANVAITVSHTDSNGKITQAKRLWGLSVRPSTPYLTTLNSGYAKNGKATVDTPRQLYSALAKRELSASASPLVVVNGLLSYLDTYPHGCTEQKVSRVFPVVGMMSHPQYREFLPDLEQHFAEVINSLRTRQRNDGGFAFWPAQSQSSQFASLYALHFLIESAQLGYPAPQDMIERGKNYLQALARKGYDTTLVAYRDRAYAIYLLTELGEITTNYLTDLEIEVEKSHVNSWKKDLTAAYMAASYSRLQDKDTAEAFVKGYNHKSLLERLEDKIYGRYLNSMALNAQYVYLVSKHFPQLAQTLAGERVLAMTAELAAGRYNTIAAAYSVLALGRYSQAVLPDPTSEQVNFTAKQATAAIAKVLTAELKPFPTVSLATSTTEVDITTDKPVFYLANDSGFNKPASQQNIKQGLEVYREYRNENGEVVTNAKQGDILTVAIRARSLDRVRHNIAIVDLLPAGFEVERDSINRNSRWQHDYYDIREDRVIFYGSMYDSLQELTYKVRVTAAGEFTIPALSAESMYQLDVKAVALPNGSSTFSVSANTR